MTSLLKFRDEVHLSWNNTWRSEAIGLIDLEMSETNKGYSQSLNAIKNNTY